MNFKDKHTIPFEKLLGKTFLDVKQVDGESRVFFIIGDGSHFTLEHEQECCESVEIEDICGDLEDLVDSEILQAEESSNSEDIDICENQTWTFYRLATKKGSVVIRWLGQSNGYYSEGVSLIFWGLLERDKK